MSKHEWESSCHHNDTCGLTGSSAFFASIPGSFIIINGPLWCYFYAMKYIDDEIKGAGQLFYCTQPDPMSLVYGTEEDIRKGLAFVEKQASPDRVFLMNNCSVGLIGDDLSGIIENFHGPWPVYAMDSGGLKGSFEKGFSNAFLRVEEEMKPLETIPHSVNLLGLSDVYLKGKEDREELKRMLEKCGITVISTPGSGSSWEDIMKGSAASFNLVVRDELGLEGARRMEKDFHIPYASVGLPYGFDGTKQWIRKVNALLGIESTGPMMKEIEEKKQEVLWKGNGLESLWGSLWFDHVLISAPPSEAFGIAEAVRKEWLDTAKLTIHLQAPSDRTTDAADEIYTVVKDDDAIRRDYENWTGGLVLSSSHETARLSRLGKSFVSCHIARPSYDEIMTSDTPYCGLRGAAALYEKIWNAKMREVN